MRVHALHMGLTIVVRFSPTVAMLCAVMLPRLKAFHWELKLCKAFTQTLGQSASPASKLGSIG